MNVNFFKNHPQWPLAEDIHRVLQGKGYQAVLAGGCVRDALLGRTPQDLDIATNAPPEIVETLFPRVVPVGKSFGVCRVVQTLDEASQIERELSATDDMNNDVNGGLNDGPRGDVNGTDKFVPIQIEVATFREEGDYKDGRRPETVTYSTIDKDALRRDFTINAMFFDLDKNEVVDVVEGQKDLAAKIIKTVGDPELRFGEDFLRILRAARFAAQLDFRIEDKTAAAMKKKAGGLQRISQERIQDECHKAFKSARPVLFFEEARKAGLLPYVFFKEMGESYEDSLWTPLKKFFAQPVDPVSGWAMLSVTFLNWAKNPQDKSNRARVRNFLKEKKLSNDIIAQVENILDAEVFLESGRIEHFIKLAQTGNIESVRKFWQREESSSSPKKPRVPKLKEFCEKYVREGKLPPPRVRGEDIKQLGVQEGPDLKVWLDKAYLYQLDHQDQNRKQIMEVFGPQIRPPDDEDED
jgi:tRNA nucleotidyltransferase (CCA-adding enzyme)